MAGRSQRRDRCAGGRSRRARRGRTRWCAWLKPRGSGRLLTVINRRVRNGGRCRGHRVPGVLDAQDGQEERAQDHLAAHDQRGHRRDHDPQRVLVVEVAELLAVPVQQREDQPGQAREPDQAAEHQAALQAELLQHPLDLRLLGQEALRAGVHLGEQPEQHGLEPDHDHGRGRDQRVHVKGHAADAERVRCHQGADNQARDEQRQAGQEEQPARAEQQQETQVPPAVPPGVQVRRPAPAVLVQRGRHLGHALAGQGRLDHHLASELHPGRLQVERHHDVPAEPAQPAVEVADLAAEEQPADEAEHRVAQVLVQRRHGPRRDPAPEPVAHHQVRALAQFVNKGHQVGEIIGIVGVAHDHVLAVGRDDATHQRVAVTLVADRYHPGAGVGGQPLAAVRAAVVGDQHLAADPALGQESHSLADARRHGLCLVEARHDHGQLHVFVSIQRQRIWSHGPVQVARRITVGEGRTHRTGRLLVVRVHQPSTGGYGLRVMPAAPSREPTARRAWSIRSIKPGRPGWTTRAGARALTARAWAGHRLFIIVLTPAVLLRVDAELGYRWHAWFNDSFQYIQNTVHFNLDPTRVSGYSIWLKILQPLHTHAVVTILQHLMALAVAVMIYALARHRFRTPAWLATLATVPVLYDGFEIQLEHLIMADVPFLFLLTLAVTLMLWDPAPSLLRCMLIGALLGLSEVMRSVGLPQLAVFAVYMIIKRISW